MFNFLLNFLSDFFVLIGYLTNLNSFPKPLSKKEEEDLILKFKSGDESARDILIERNLRLVAYVAKKYYQCPKDYEDLISIGTIGLIKAINNFDNDKGIRLATYAVRCIQNEILMCLRSEKKLVNEVSINEPIGFDYEGNEINLMDILTDEEEAVFNEVNLNINIKKLYEGVESVLDEREKKIISLRYGLYNKKPLTQKQVAKKLDISRSYVSRIEKKAIEKLELFFK
ncbi:MAG: RNA polymerase sporulation sigma factor SigK [Clostridia bacterium]|nr:RNA polymerase sporulation sigma factor SigK [Oscillospiraceae bacterium]MBR4892519.1 RNA polymerase sporulation sigma factor SigK [Clostridia bacterium]